MPARLLRDCTRSQVIASVTPEVELTFYRLIQRADDEGFLLADPKCVKAECFPLHPATEAEIAGWVARCGEVGLVRLGVSPERKLVLQICNFGQKVRWPSRIGPIAKELAAEDYRRVCDNHPKFADRLAEVQAICADLPQGSPPRSDKQSDQLCLFDTGEPNGVDKRTAATSNLARAMRQLTDAWNALGCVPAVRNWTDARKTHLRARLQEPDWLEHALKAIAQIPSSPFLRGENERGWRANIDWLLRPDSVNRVLEGFYHGRRKTSNYAAGPGQMHPDDANAW